MENNMLAKAFGEIETEYIVEAIEYKKKDSKRLSRGKWVAILLLVAGALHFTAYHTNAQYRQWFISLFKLSRKEQVPDDSKTDENIGKEKEQTEKGRQKDQVISLYATDTIDDLFEVKYLKSDGYLAAEGDYYYYVDRETGEERYYVIEDGAFVSSEDIPEYDILNDEEIIDSFSDIRIQGRYLKDYAAVEIWSKVAENCYVVLVGDTRETAGYYLIDREMSRSLEEISGLAEVSFAKAVEGCLMLGVYVTEEEDVFSYYCYNLQDQSLKLIYENAAFLQADFTDEKTLYVSFTGERYDLVLQGDSVYLADEITGNRHLIEGMEKEFAQNCSPISNPSGNRLLVTGAFSSEGITQLGIIDIAREKFFLLERSNLLPVEECNISWKDDDTIAIQAEDATGNGSSLYLYTIKQ